MRDVFRAGSPVKQTEMIASGPWGTPTFAHSLLLPFLFLLLFGLGREEGGQCGKRILVWEGTAFDMPPPRRGRFQSWEWCIGNDPPPVTQQATIKEMEEELGGTKNKATLCNRWRRNLLLKNAVGVLPRSKDAFISELKTWKPYKYQSLWPFRKQWVICHIAKVFLTKHLNSD